MFLLFLVAEILETDFGRKGKSDYPDEKPGRMSKKSFARKTDISPYLNRKLPKV